MPTITFDVPEGALSALRLSPTEFVKEMRVAAAPLVLAGRAFPVEGRRDRRHEPRGVH